MSIRVYEYGLLPPHQNSELVLDQMRLAHRYRNMLTEIDRERRLKVREIMSSHQDMVPLQAQIDEITTARNAAREAIAKKRATTRSRSDSKGEREAIQALNAQIRDVVAQIKAIRKDVAADPTVQLGLKLAEQHARQRVRDERAKCGVYWGTYLLQEADADRSRQEPAMPKFSPFRGDGRVSVQLQGGLELDALWGSDTQLRISPVDPDAYNLAKPRGGRRRASRTELSLRVQSARSRPVWARFPMIMHRPLPEGAVVKVATVIRRRRDCVSWYWRLQLTVDTTACKPARAPAQTSGALALNLGFCMRPGGAIRSGYLLGTDGESLEVLAVKSDLYREDRELGQEERDRALNWITNGLKKADDIQSIRDNNLNLFKAQFAPWRATQVEPGEPGPTPPATQEQPGEPGPSIPDDHPGGDPGHIAKGSEQRGVAGTDRLAEHVERIGMSPTEIVELEWKLKSIGAAPLEQLGRAGTLTVTGVPNGSITQEQPAIANGSEQPGAAPGRSAAVLTGRAWFVSSTEFVSQWLSAARFRALSFRWELERFEGDEDGFAMLCAWRERDEHLERYQSGIRGSALRDRQETYRIIASKMVKRYQTLLIDSTDLSKYQDAGNTEDEPRDNDIVRKQQRIAAGSLLRSALMNAFGPERTVKMPPEKRTTTCHSCRVVNQWDRTAGDRVHRCSACGEQWDIDANFCQNLINDWASSPAEDTKEEEPKKPSRSQRLRSAAAAKVALAAETD